MLCPNCGSHLTIIHLHGQTIAHCSSCGGSLFEPNGINKLTLFDAKKLARLAEKPIVLNKTKVCPYDGNNMKMISGEAIPDFVTLFSCPECARVWGYPQDIIDFKIAQKSTIDYYQAWRRPLPALKTILVMSVMLTIGISSSYVFYRYSTNNSSQTFAEDITKTIRFQQAGDAVLMYFTTSTPYTSEALFTSPTGFVNIEPIAKEPTTLHTAVFTKYPFDGSYSVRIRLTAKDKTKTFPAVKFE